MIDFNRVQGRSATSGVADLAGEDGIHVGLLHMYIYIMFHLFYILFFRILFLYITVYIIVAICFPACNHT